MPIKPSTFRDVEDIKAEIRRHGQRISTLSETLGFTSSALSARWKMARAWPELDARLAKFLGVEPQHLFPAHYHSDGRPKAPTRKLRTTRKWGAGWRPIAGGDLTS